MVQFARWVAERDYRAALMAAGLTLLPLLAVISCAVLAAAAFQRGPGAGWRSAGIAAAVLALVAFSAGVSPASAVLPAVAVWAPTVAMTHVLVATGSLSIVARLAAGGSLVLAAVLLSQAPWDAWREAISGMAAQLAAGSGMDAAELAGQVVKVMPGVMSASILLASLLGLFLGMWLHAAHSRPGAFGEAFRSLQAGPLVGGMTAMAAAGAFATGAPVAAAAWPLGTLMCIQGLAVLHGLAKARGWHRTWLVTVWLALFLAFPWAAIGVGLYGLLDTFLDFRRRPATQG